MVTAWCWPQAVKLIRASNKSRACKMAAFKPVSLFCPLWTSVRHKSKPNIGKTRLPHYIRLQVLETTKPVFAPDRRPDSVTCAKISESLITAPKLTKYESLLAQEAIQFMDSSSLIGFYHLNSITGRQMNELKRTLFFSGMSFGEYDCSILRHALKETRYEAVVPLFENPTSMVFSKEPNVKLLLKLQKKMPQLVLLCGMVDNRLLTREMLEWYSELPNIDVMRSHLCSTLSTLGVQLTRHLGYHQSQLCQSLTSLVSAGSGHDASGPPAAGDGDAAIPDESSPSQP